VADSQYGEAPPTDETGASVASDNAHQTIASSPQSPVQQRTAENFQETRLALLRFISISLVILTSLALMVLVAIRRLNGLG
jgi:hypothetical protein